MGHEQLEKGLAEVRRVKAVWEDTGSGLKSVQSRATLDQALDEAKCKLAMAIGLAGGSNWVIQRHLHLFMLVKFVRGLGCMDLAEADFIRPGEAKYNSMQWLFNLLKNKANDAAVAAALGELRIKFGEPLRTCDNMIAICGRFFCFVGDKYEVME